MEHRAQHLKISNGLPEVTRLYNGRYRQEFRCVGINKNDWYYGNIDRILADFGSLSDAPIVVDGEGGADPIPEAIFPNMTLMHVALEYTPSGTLVVYFRYETLTDEFVQETADKVDYEMNGLRRVTRQVIANEDATYSDVVGVSDITHNAHGYGDSTLYLASVVEAPKPSEESGYVRLVETWLEAGIISEEFSTLEGGLRQVNRVSFYEKNSPSGIVVDEKKDNYNGYPVWSTSTIQSSTGGSVTSGNALEYSSYVPFQYPGIANCVEVELTAIPVRKVYDVTLDAPTTAEVLATTEISYQTSDTIGTLPYTFWNPDSWAKMSAYWLTNNLEPTSVYRSLPNYRVGDDDTVTYSGGATQVSFLGRFVYTSGGATATIEIDGGPEDPEGNTYVIQRPTLDEAFVDTDGVKYYRLTVVYATIPER